MDQTAEPKLASRQYEKGVVERITDIQRPPQEWRRCFSELLGRSSWCWWPPVAE